MRSKTRAEQVDGQGGGASLGHSGVVESVFLEARSSCRAPQLEFRLERGDEAVLQWILRTMYVPMYGPIVTLPPGVAE